MLAGDAFADILETVWTAFTVLAHWKAFTSLRSVQNDTGETRFFYPGRGGGVKVFVKAGWHGLNKRPRLPSRSASFLRSGLLGPDELAGVHAFQLQ